MADNTSWPTDLDTHVQYLIDKAVEAAVTAKLAQASGLATLGSDSLVPTAQLPAYFGITSDALTGYLNDLDQYQQSTPTLEELVICGGMDSFNGQRGQNGATTWAKTVIPQPISDAFTLSLFVAPFAMKINSFALCWEYWSLVASDTNYWTFGLQVKDGSTYTTLATRKTTATGTDSGGSITSRIAYTFDTASWADYTVPVGAVVQLNAAPSKVKTTSGNNYVQSCTPFGAPMNWTTRYSPV